MSSDEPADDEDRELAPFILMRAGETFDGQERVMSRAAYDLQVLATAHSGVLRPPRVRARRLPRAPGRPGRRDHDHRGGAVRHRHRERAGGGYRVLDWEAVEFAHNAVRQSRSEDPQALAAERDHGAKIQARMATPMLITPPCAACGAPSAHIELVAPGQLPAGWDQRLPGTTGGSILRRPEPGRWYLLATDIATGTSYGGPIDASLAGQIAWAFRPPLRFAQVHAARFDGDAGFCPDCDAPYCHQHWHLSDTGYGYCSYGHGKDLDPHWSPFTDTSLAMTRRPSSVLPGRCGPGVP